MRTGSFSVFPEGYPAIPYRNMTQKDLEDLLEIRGFERLEGEKKWSRELDIAGYIEACSQMNLSLYDWIGFGDDHFTKKYGLPDLIKGALKSEARKLNEQIRKKREEDLSELKFKNTEVNRGLSNTNSNGGHMSRVFK